MLIAKSINRSGERMVRPARPAPGKLPSPAGPETLKHGTTAAEKQPTIKQENKDDFDRTGNDRGGIQPTGPRAVLG